MEVLTPELLWFMADEVLSCVCDALTAQSECGCPCRTFVSAGAPAWDDCCEGQLAAWVEAIYPYETFPIRQSTPPICGTQLAGDFALQLLRCAPTVTDSGAIPSGPVLDDSARRVYQDMYIAANAVICCLAEAKRNRLYVVRDTRMVGPQGGCVGFEIRFTVQLTDPVPGTV